MQPEVPLLHEKSIHLDLAPISKASPKGIYMTTEAAEVLAFLRNVADTAEVRLIEIADGSLPKRLIPPDFDHWKEYQRIKRFRRRLREIECAGKDADLATAEEYAYRVWADLLEDDECESDDE
jgi:hypothetical protein